MAIPRINYYRFSPINNEEAPLEIYKSVIDNVVERYDKNLDYRDKISRALGSIQSNQYGNEYLKSVSERVNNSLNTIAKGQNGKVRWDLAEDTIRNLANEISNDKVLQSIKLSHDNYIEGLKTQRDLSEKGEAVNVGEDYEDFKPVNKDGTVNIYQPLWQPKADTYNAIKKIAKDLPTEIDLQVKNDPNLPGYLILNQQKRAVAGIKERLLPDYYEQYINSSEGKQEAILMQKQLKKQGLSDDQIKKAIAKSQFQTVNDNIDLVAQELVENKPQLIQDQVYARNEQAVLRRELQEDAQRQQEQNIRLRAEEQIRVPKEKAALKASGSRTSETSQVLSPSSGISHIKTRTGTGVTNGVSGFNNKLYVDAIGATAMIHTGTGSDAWKNVDIGDYSVDINPEKDRIVKFEPKGIVAYNEGRSDFDGGWHGNLTYIDSNGKERTVPATVVNSNQDYKALYQPVAQLRRQQDQLEQRELNASNNFHLAVAPKDLVAANQNYFPLSKVPIYLQTIRTKEGTKIVPLIKINDKDFARVNQMSQSYRNQLGIGDIKGTYSLDQIRNMADNEFADELKVQAKTSKMLAE